VELVKKFMAPGLPLPHTAIPYPDREVGVVTA
jgi:hypothetical protein